MARISGDFFNVSAVSCPDASARSPAAGCSLSALAKPHAVSSSTIAKRTAIGFFIVIYLLDTVLSAGILRAAEESFSFYERPVRQLPACPKS